MTREDVTKMFPDATADQITNMLNQVNSEVSRERSKVDRYKEDAKKAEELQRQIDELKRGKMTEMERLTQDLEDSKARVAELERIGAIRDKRAAACEKWNLTGEQAAKVIKDDGELDYDLLGEYMAGQRTAAVEEYKKQELERTPNPTGGIGGQNENSALQFAKAAAKRANSADANIINAYRR